jgi:GNAT superfamily N-acetyltransferase
MLKIAQKTDFPVLFEMGMKFAKTTEYKDYITEDYVANTINQILDQEMGTIALMHGEDGMLLGTVLPFQFGPYFTASEVAWWVNEDKRKSSIGTELLEAFEEWARRVGADFVHMVSLDDAVGKYYEKKGYKLLERAYIKKI